MTLLILAPDIREEREKRIEEKNYLCGYACACVNWIYAYGHGFGVVKNYYNNRLKG